VWKKIVYPLVYLSQIYGSKINNEKSDLTLIEINVKREVPFYFIKKVLMIGRK